MKNKILTKENLWYSYLQTQKGKPKHKVPAVRFRQQETSNLNRIFDSLSDETWKPSAYYKFKITEKKERTIYAPAYQDKIVHHMVYQVLRDFYEPKFIYDSYSCIRGKGNIAAVKRIQHHLRVHSRNNKETWLVKLDVSKFFPSIDREILKRIYRKKVICRFTLDLLDKIIDSSPTPKGLPLGCVTSQLSANVYMNEFDHFVKRTLKVKHYVRYADDLFIFCSSKEEANILKGKCKAFLASELNLSCPNEKSYIQKCSSLISGLGYKIAKTHLLVKGESKRRFIKRWKSLSKKSNREILSSLNSWCSYSRIAQSYKFSMNFCNDKPVRYFKGKFYLIKQRRVNDLLK